MPTDMTATFNAIRIVLESVRHDPTLTRSAHRTLIRSLANLTAKAVHAHQDSPNVEVLELLSRVVTTTAIKDVPYDTHFLLTKALDLVQQPPEQVAGTADTAAQ